MSPNKKFVMFALNFPYNWVEDCFLEKAGKNMTDHLKTKWEDAYTRGGSSGALIHFYAMLDRKNSAIVDEYINNHY